MISKRRHQIALATASVGVTAGLMIIALPLVPQVGAHLDNAVLAEMGMAAEMPPHVMRYGAIAYSPSGAWGRALGYKSQTLADQVALAQCGDKDCEVIIGFRLCGAVAYDGSTYVGGSGATRSMAEANALNSLPGGKIVNLGCQQHS